MLIATLLCLLKFLKNSDFKLHDSYVAFFFFLIYKFIKASRQIDEGSYYRFIYLTLIIFNGLK